MQYPRVITLIDGKNETLFSVDDLEYLIDRYMGFDALSISEPCGRNRPNGKTIWQGLLPT